MLLSDSPFEALAFGMFCTCVLVLLRHIPYYWHRGTHGLEPVMCPATQDEDVFAMPGLARSQIKQVCKQRASG